MPLPVAVLYVLGAAVLTFFVGGAGAAAGATVYANWPQMMGYWKGKHLAVLGDSKVGKTCIVKFLTEGDIPEGYDETYANTPTHHNSFSMKDFQFYIHAIQDVPGREQSRDANVGGWKDVLNEAQVVLYLFRADLLWKGHAATIGRVESDLDFIYERLELRDDKARIQIALIGTYADLIPEFESPNLRPSFVKTFAESEQLKRLVNRMGGTARTFVFVGVAHERYRTAEMILTMARLLAVPK